MVLDKNFKELKNDVGKEEQSSPVDGMDTSKDHTLAVYLAETISQGDDVYKTLNESLLELLQNPPYMWTIKRNDTNELPYKTETHRHRE